MDVRDIGALALTLAVAGIIVSFTLLVMATLQTQIGTQSSTHSAAYNATGSAIEGIAVFSDWFVLIALAIVFSIIIGIIVKYIGGAGNQ